MPKKKSHEQTIVQTMLVSVALATAVPLVTLVFAQSDDQANTHSSSSDDAIVYKQFHDREDQTKLFNAAEFRKAARARYDKNGFTVSSSATSSQPALPPCNPAATSSVPSAEAPVHDAALQLQDLDAQQQRDLRMQLRIGGCPFDALPGYRELCESLLKDQQRSEPPVSLKPLKNSVQAAREENAAAHAAAGAQK